MKDNMMRAPLLKAGGVLLVFVLLTYLTCTSPEGSVFASVGQIIIGAFRLVQWGFAMVIGLTVCIAVLIGVFLFAAFLVDREKAASMYRFVKEAVCVCCQPVCSRTGAFLGRDREKSCMAPPVREAVAPTQFKEDLQAIVADAVGKVVENQQALSAQLSVLADNVQALEKKSADFAAADQVHAIASNLAVSGQTVAAFQGQVAALESKIDETVRQLQNITPESMLGDMPARLQQLEQRKDEQPKDVPPQPATAPPVASVPVESVPDQKQRKSSGGVAKTKTKKKS
jgi:hypothetical protein